MLDRERAAFIQDVAEKDAQGSLLPVEEDKGESR